MQTSSEGIFGSRPWRIYGEGPATLDTPEAGEFGGARDVRTKPYSIEEVRFTTKGGALYAYLLAPKPAARITIKALAKSSPHTLGRSATHVALLGGGSVEWTQREHGLEVKLPESLPSTEAIGLRISGVV